MFNLRRSCFDDIEMKVENKYILNDYLYKLIFDFCDAKDLCQISQCSEDFNKIAKKLDYKFLFSFEDNYCSSYSNYE